VILRLGERAIDEDCVQAKLPELRDQDAEVAG